MRRQKKRRLVSYYRSTRLFACRQQQKSRAEPLQRHPSQTIPAHPLAVASLGPSRLRRSQTTKKRAPKVGKVLKFVVHWLCQSARDETRRFYFFLIPHRPCWSHLPRALQQAQDECSSRFLCCHCSGQNSERRSKSRRLSVMIRIPVRAALAAINASFVSRAWPIRS